MYARSLGASAVLLSSQVPSERPLIRQVEVDTPEGKVTKLTPCSPGAPDAIERTWTDVQSDELLEPLVSVKDFEKAIQVNRPTVSQADIAKHIAFTNESGEWAGARTRRGGEAARRRGRLRRRIMTMQVKGEVMKEATTWRLMSPRRGFACTPGGWPFIIRRPASG